MFVSILLLLGVVFVIASTLSFGNRSSRYRDYDDVEDSYLPRHRDHYDNDYYHPHSFQHDYYYPSRYPLPPPYPYVPVQHHFFEREMLSMFRLFVFIVLAILAFFAYLKVDAYFNPGASRSSEKVGQRWSTAAMPAANIAVPPADRPGSTPKRLLNVPPPNHAVLLADCTSEAQTQQVFRLFEQWHVTKQAVPGGWIVYIDVKHKKDAYRVLDVLFEHWEILEKYDIHPSLIDLNEYTAL